MRESPMLTEWVATTQFGLDEILALELAALGATEIKKHNRAVSFRGDSSVMFRANLCLRTALRILRPIHRFHASNERELYEELRRIEWDEYLHVDGTLAVHANLTSTFFTHSHFISQKTKDAIVDYFREKYGKRPSVDLQQPDLSIHIHIFKDDVTVSLDSSAESLHRRGYRLEQTLAPINEVTAAGMIMLSGWDGKSNFVDPMCGSGTFPIEAAMIAGNIPPNLHRKQFGFERWTGFERKLWEQVKSEATARISKIECQISGSDKTFKAIEISRENARRAGVEDDIHFVNQRFEEMTPAKGGGVLMINPPYGERLDQQETFSLYKAMGDKMKKDFKGYTAWIISSNLDALKKIGLAASQKITLFNGALECRFHKFELYDGSRKKAPKPHSSNQSSSQDS